MSLRPRAALLAAVAALSLIACTEADNGNNTLAYNQTEQPSAPSTPPGAPQSTAPAEPGGPDGPIELEAKDNVFAPDKLTVPAGSVTIVMENTGQAPHTFTNTDLKVDVNADGGKTAEIKLDGLKPGTYKFICKYHETLNPPMVGELTVT